MKQTRMIQFLIPLVFVVLVLPTAFAAEGTFDLGDTADSGANPVVVAYRYEPAPATPGKTLDVWLTVENRGEMVAEGVQVRFVGDYPFSVEESATQSIGVLDSFQRSRVKFEVRVDERAVTGTNPLDFEILYDGTNKKNTARINVDIRPLDYLVSIGSIDVTPSPAPQGNDVMVRVYVENRGSTLVRSVTAIASVPESTFVPVGESNRQVLDYIEGGKSGTFTYRFIVDPDAESGPYTVPLTLSFFDIEGNQINQTQNMGLVVGSEPKLSVLVDQSEITTEQHTGTVTLRFINRGSEDIKFAHAEITPTTEVTILDGQETYIGEIDSDDFETLDIRVRVNGRTHGKLNLPVTLEYADANNKQYREELTVSTPIFSPQELGTGGGSLFVYLVVLVILGGGATWWYRRRKKTKKKR